MKPAAFKIVTSILAFCVTGCADKGDSLFGVPKPPAEIEAAKSYCKKNLPPRIASRPAIAGYAFKDYQCSPEQCVNNYIYQKWFKGFGEYAFKQSRADDLFPREGLLRIAAYPEGDPACEPFQKHLDSVHRQTTKAPEGTCIAVEPIEEFSAPVAYRKKGTVLYIANGSNYQISGNEIVDLASGNILAQDVRFHMSQKEKGGQIIDVTCQNGSGGSVLREFLAAQP